MSPQQLSTEFLLKNVRRLRDALDEHNATCDGRVAAFVLHPYDRGVLPFEELWGIPLVENPERAVKGVWLACPLHHEGGGQLSLGSSE